MLAIAHSSRLTRAGSVAYQAAWVRELRLFEVIKETFSKEKRTERLEKLKGELQRGYFDDFRDFRDSGGKVFPTAAVLTPAASARRFPHMRVVLPDGSEAAFPGDSPAHAPKASLCCAAFRAGAQDMLEAWSAPFAREFTGRAGVAYYELALIESAVMSRWPFRGMLLRSAAAGGARAPLPTTHLFSFRPDPEVLRALRMSNKLTGYAYLLDATGRVRWQACGKPQPSELKSMLDCAQRLLESS